MKVDNYILSLKGSIRQIDFIENNKKIDIKFNFFDAVVGSELYHEYIKNIQVLGKVKYRRKIGCNEIACADSHIKIYESMLKNNVEWALILEDDMILCKELDRFNEFDFSKIEAENLYILGGQQGLISFQMVVESKKDQINIGGIELKKLVDSERYIYRTCSYLINIKVAEKIIKLRQNSFFLADDWLWMKKNNIFKEIYFSNVAVHQEDISLSTIEIERVKKRNFFEKLKSSNLRKIKVLYRKIYLRNS